MSSFREVEQITFLAGGAIVKGTAVKFGADSKHVVVSAGPTDNAFGIAQNDAAAAEDLVEVAMNGGGAKALAQATVALGAKLASHTDGKLRTAVATENVIAFAMESAVVGDIFAVEVSLPHTL